MLPKLIIVYLYTVISSSSIAAANKEVKQADKPEKKSKRGAYEHLTPVDATYDGLYSVGAHQADY